jgi:PPOX class probable F420-dependent enzyme
MATIPDRIRDIFAKRSFVHLATLMPDGSPQVSPVWVDVDGDQVVINSAQGRMKDENMRRDPRVALSVTDPDNPYRSVMMRGRVVDITTEGADEHIDRMAKKSLDQDKYPFRGKDEVRVIYRIEVDKISIMGG